MYIVTCKIIRNHKTYFREEFNLDDSESYINLLYYLRKCRYDHSAKVVFEMPDAWCENYEDSLRGSDV